MSSLRLAPGLFGFPGMPATASAAASGSWYGKGPRFQTGASQALSEASFCANSQAPDSVILHAHALMMPTRHILTAKPKVQQNQDAPSGAQHACTALRCQPSPPPRLSTLPHPPLHAGTPGPLILSLQS